MPSDKKIHLFLASQIRKNEIEEKGAEELLAITEQPLEHIPLNISGVQEFGFPKYEDMVVSHPPSPIISFAPLAMEEDYCDVDL